MVDFLRLSLLQPAGKHQGNKLGLKYIVRAHVSCHIIMHQSEWDHAKGAERLIFLAMYSPPQRSPKACSSLKK